ncbi:MAG: molybdopterin cofactor-binding domain-containing protein, partial [Acidobacteriota bacterium]
MRSRRDVLRDAKHGIIEEESSAPQRQGRRQFITVSLAATGGLLVAMRLEPVSAQAQGAAPSGPVGFATDYIQIDPDDRVLIWSAQPEMGEGTKTSLPMLIAEELDADWSKVRIDDAPLDRKYGGQGVGGSDAMRFSWDNMRRIGATARQLLIAAAAAEWNVPAAECDTAAHVVRHPASNREARYGSLAARAATLTVPRNVAMKDPSRYRLIGTR